MGIRQNLMALITKENITQEALARTIGRTQGAVSQWINGSKPPSMASIRRICEAYGLSESDILSESDGLYAKLHGLTEAPAGAIAPSRSKPAFLPLMGRVHAGEPQDPDVMEGCMCCPSEGLVPFDSEDAAGVIDIDKAAEAEREAVDWLSGRFGFLEYAVDVSAVSEAGAEDFAAFRVKGTAYECSGGRLKVVER